MSTKHRRVVERIAEIAGSKADLARRLNVSPQTVNNWISRGIPLAMCPVISAEFGIPMHELRVEFKPVAQAGSAA